jgi:hypothetical protein
MAHSFREMQDLCRQMAEDARPEDAAAINEIMSNYQNAVDSSPPRSAWQRLIGELANRLWSIIR